MASLVKTDRKEYYIVYIILVFNFFCLTTIIVLMWTLTGSTHKAADCKTICTPCSSGICCGCLATTLSHYVHKTTQKDVSEFMEVSEDETKFQKLQARTFPKFEPWQVNPSALLQGDRSYKENTEERPFQTVRGWHLGYEDYIRNGVELIDGRLWIPKDGLYNVYSHILFGDNSQSQDYKNMEQKVCRYNIVDRIEEELLSNTHPYTQLLSNYMTTFSSYINSDVKLRVGDLIYVKVSNISKLKQRNSDYFGIYKL